MVLCGDYLHGRYGLLVQSKTKRCFLILPTGFSNHRTQKLMGNISSYFLGGFSAYRTVPSGRHLKPFWMIFHIRMVWRALKGYIQGNFYVPLFSFFYKRAEIF